MKKLLSFFLVVAFIVALYGCHTGGHSPFANVNSDGLASLSRIVDANGRFTDIIFNHTDCGQTRITCENGTLQEGVVIEVSENKSTAQSLAQDGSVYDVYIYTIDAYLETTDALGTHRTHVESLQKPLTITLPTEHLGTTGICYVGVRYSETDPWQYRRVSENGTITLNARLSSASSNQLQKEYDCSFFRLGKNGIQIALFLYNDSNVPEEEKSKIISVNNISSSGDSEIEVENSAYCSDLNLLINLLGENLGNLNAADITIKLTYRSQNSEHAKIKVNGFDVKYSSVRDDAVKGKSYYSHTFELPKLSFKSNDGTQAVLAYVLGIKDVLTREFPNEFLIELSGILPDNAIKTFGYSEYFKFAKKGDAGITITVIPYESNVIDTVNNRYTLGPKFYVKIDSDTPLTSNEINEIRKAFTLRGEGSNNINFVATEYINGSFTVSLDGNLSEGQEYSIGMDEVTVGDNTFFLLETITFITAGGSSGSGDDPDSGEGITITVVPYEGNIIDTVNNLYVLSPAFYVKCNVTLTSDQISKIKDAIDISGEGVGNVTKKATEFSNGSFTLYLEGNLLEEKEYSIEKKSGDSTINSFDKITFKTAASFNVTLTPTEDCFQIAEGMYYTKPSYKMTLSKAYSLPDATRQLLKKFIAVKQNGELSDMEVVFNVTQNGIVAGFADYLEASSTCNVVIPQNVKFNGLTVTFTNAPGMEIKTFTHKGRGTEAEPFLVENGEQLAAIYTSSVLASSSNYLSEQNVKYFFKQTDDLDLSSYGEQFPKIGDYNRYEIFIGNYDGNNKTISNLKINLKEDGYRMGLFAFNKGTIQNLNITNSSVSGHFYTALLCGENQGTIKNVNITNSSVSGCGEGTAAICPNNWGTVENCHVSKTTIVDTPEFLYSYLGGLVAINGNSNGAFKGYINNSSCSEVTLKGKELIGGLAGRNYCEIDNCYVENSTIEGNASIGGLVGDDISEGGKITNSYVIGTTITPLTIADGHLEKTGFGGLVGWIYRDVTISDCYVKKSVINQPTDTKFGDVGFGGLIGFIQNGNGIIRNCYCEEVEINGNNKEVDQYNGTGGLIGYCNNTKVELCHVIDSKIKGHKQIGGLIGLVAKVSNIQSSYVSNTELIAISNNTGSDWPQRFGYVIGYLTDSKLIGCYASDNKVTNDSGKNFYTIGGLVGHAGQKGNNGDPVTIMHCYIKLGSYAENLTNITATEGRGLLFGWLEKCNINITAERCYVVEDGYGESMLVGSKSGSGTGTLTTDGLTSPMPSNSDLPPVWSLYYDLTQTPPVQLQP